MAKYIPTKELEDLKPRIANVTHKLMGYSDPSLVTVVMNCITSGHDKAKMAGKAIMYVSSYKALKLYLSNTIPNPEVKCVILDGNLKKQIEIGRNCRDGIRIGLIYFINRKARAATVIKL